MTTKIYQILKMKKYLEIPIVTNKLQLIKTYQVKLLDPFKLFLKKLLLKQLKNQHKANIQFKQTVFTYHTKNNKNGF